MSNGIRKYILAEIDEERVRQQGFWGNDFDNRNTPNDWIAFVTRYVSDAVYDGRDQKFNIAHYREQLIKAAAICYAAIETLDRNYGRIAPRHYETVKDIIYFTDHKGETNGDT